MRPLIVAVALIPLTLLAGVAPARAAADDLTFICESVEFADGTPVHAVVRLHQAGPTVDVEYYSADGQELLGWYEEAGPVMPPYDADRAWTFAMRNYPWRARPE